MKLPKDIEKMMCETCDGLIYNEGGTCPDCNETGWKQPKLNRDIEKRLRIGLDEIFEEAHSYTGPNIDETFDRVFAFSKQFIADELERQKKELKSKHKEEEMKWER